MIPKIKYIVAIFILALHFSPSVAQQIEGGIHVGVGLNKYSNWVAYRSGSNITQKLDNPMNGGLFIGLFTSKMFSEYLGMQVELNFEQKGFTMEIPDQKLSSNISYLTIPLLAKGHYSWHQFDFNLLLGFYFGLGIGGKVKSFYQGEEISEKKVEFGSGPVSDGTTYAGGPKGYQAKRFDLGMIFGIQPSYSIGPGKAFIDVRYSLGFLGIDNPTKENKENDEIINGPWYQQANRTLTFSAGYSINLSELFGK